MENVDSLRFLTLGSVDSGKSTLVGRLLYDSKGLFEDQLEALQRTADLSGGGAINLANLTDGLRAEREQGITIDVAYRYFATPKRRFILVDSPGHEQYTRNVVTGATTCDLALVVVEADRGLREQSRRLLMLAHLVGIQHFVICINKMDRVDFSENRFQELRAQIQDYLGALGVEQSQFIPICALQGDNVVDRSHRTGWYDGPSLLAHLETTEFPEASQVQAARFPVQWVIRPDPEHGVQFRGYAGQVASGVFRVGDTLTVYPSGKQTTIAGIHTFDGELDQVSAPMSATLVLTDEIDVGRGDMLVSGDRPPKVAQDLTLSLCWMAERKLRVGGTYLLRQTTRTTRCLVEEVAIKLDAARMEIQSGETGLELNEIGLVKLRALSALCYDPYEENRGTGSVILIDEAEHQTVAAGMLDQDLQGKFSSWTHQAAL